MNAYEKGIDNLNVIIDRYKWPKNKTIFIEGLKNFGDTLHSSIVVRHYRKLFPNDLILWGISDKYFKQFKIAADMMGVVVFNLPHEATNENRQNWKKHFKTLGLHDSIFPLCAVSGFDVSGSIVDNVLHNANIKKLSVPRRPFFPHSGEDYSWHDKFCQKHGLKGKGYVVLEYNSYTLSKPPHNCTWPIEKYNELVKLIKYPVVFTASSDDPPLNNGIDARGCSWAQAKVMIERSGCLVGCGSGLSVLACSEGLNTYVIEINIGNTITVKSMYNIPSVSTKTDEPEKIANAINKCIAGLAKK